jgi:hypothetical protein
MDAFPHLIQAFTSEQLTTSLHQFLNPTKDTNPTLTQNYKQDRKNFLKQYFNADHPEPVCDMIIQTALSQLKQISKN